MYGRYNKAEQWDRSGAASAVGQRHLINGTTVLHIFVVFWLLNDKVLG